jgi:two-component system, NarL family, sensor kinase
VPPVVIEAVRARWAKLPPLALPFTAVCAAAVTAVAVPTDVVTFPLVVVWLVGWLSLPLAGAVLLDTEPRDRTGTVLALAGFCPAVAGLAVGERGITAVVAASYAGAPAVALLGVFLPLVFPTPVRGRPAWLVGALAGTLAAAASTAALVARFSGGPAPRPWVVGGLATALVGAAAVVLSARDWRRLLPPDRDRRGWLLLGAVLWWSVVAAAVGVAPQAARWPGVTYVLAGLTCLAAAGVVVLRRAAESIPLDRAVARAVATALGLAGVTLTYLVAVAALARVGLPDSRVAAAVLAALVAVLLLPLWVVARDRLATRAFGIGHRPEVVLAELGRRLAQPLDQQDLLDSLAEAVAAAVRSPEVTIRLAGEDDEPAADDGTAVVPLPWAGERVGSLRVRPRRPGERFRGRDLRVIAQLAAPVAAVAASAALGRRLERSELARLEAARRERESIRCDLHDDLGPLLAGIGMQLAAASALLPDDHPAAVPVRGRLDAASAVVEQSRAAVRRLVDALAPATQHGLPAAVEAVVADWADAASGRPVFRAEVDPAAELPSAGTATVLRILGEALTNVVRHADAGSCLVRLARQGSDVVLDVIDDGVGAGAATGLGVGTVSMRQRAEELGGRLTITAAEPRGTHLRAVVPAGATA